MHRDEPPHDNTADMLEDVADRIAEILGVRAVFESQRDTNDTIEELVTLVSETAQRLKDADVCANCFANELAAVAKMEWR